MADDFDAVIAGADYPVVIVTTVDPRTGERAGCLAGFLAQCSIDPVRLLICLSVQNHTYRVATGARHLAVHFLEHDQRELAALFGTRTGDDVDKFASCESHRGPDGLPLVTACPRWLTGRVCDRIPLGDHVGFLLEPTAYGDGGDRPVLMFSAVRDLDAGHEA